MYILKHFRFVILLYTFVSAKKRKFMNQKKDNLDKKEKIYQH